MERLLHFVTSISFDLHKFPGLPKGTSAVFWLNRLGQQLFDARTSLFLDWVMPYGTKRQEGSYAAVLCC